MSVRERHQRERAARREAILSAAARVFAIHGLDGATIEMIAREAEVAVGTIYLYFCSRDELFLTLMVDRISELRDRYREIQAQGLAPIDELRTMARAYIDYLSSSRGLFVAQLSVAFSKLPARFARAEELDRYRALSEVGREGFQLWRESVARVFAHDAAVMATMMWATLNGSFLLSGDDDFFRDLTGQDPTSLLAGVFDFQLDALVGRRPDNRSGVRSIE
ncbi:MAG: TetR/AcrR family transcriptional regulator, partial [Candidatus Binataceae bacterium]